MSTISSGSGDQTDIFAPMPYQDMGQEGSILKLTDTENGQTTGGNAVFQDTQVDASNPDNTITTLTVYQISSGGDTSLTMLNNLQPNEPQIIPDPDLTSSGSQTFTFTTEEVNEKASELNIDPSQMAADVALYGPTLTNFAISQDINPSQLAKEVNSSADALGLTPPILLTAARYPKCYHARSPHRRKQ